MRQVIVKTIKNRHFGFELYVKSRKMQLFTDLVFYFITFGHFYF